MKLFLLVLFISLSVSQTQKCFSDQISLSVLTRAEKAQGVVLATFSTSGTSISVTVEKVYKLPSILKTCDALKSFTLEAPEELASCFPKRGLVFFDAEVSNEISATTSFKVHEFTIPHDCVIAIDDIITRSYEEWELGCTIADPCITTDLLKCPVCNIATLIDVCLLAKCESHPNAVCKGDGCTGPHFYIDGKEVDCAVPPLDCTQIFCPAIAWCLGCPAYPDAKCVKDGCCNYKYVDEYGAAVGCEIKDDCSNVRCVDPCSAGCPSHPDAQCKVVDCCSAVYVGDDGKEVNCTEPVIDCTLVLCAPSPFPCAGGCPAYPNAKCRTVDCCKDEWYDSNDQVVSCEIDNPCTPYGCNGEYCYDRGDLIALPLMVCDDSKKCETECFKNAICEKQTNLLNSKCGWTMTEQSLLCLKSCATVTKPVVDPCLSLGKCRCGATDGCGWCSFKTDITASYDVQIGNVEVQTTISPSVVEWGLCSSDTTKCVDPNLRTLGEFVTVENSVECRNFTISSEVSQVLETLIKKIEAVDLNRIQEEINEIADDILKAYAIVIIRLSIPDLGSDSLDNWKIFVSISGDVDPATDNRKISALCKHIATASITAAGVDPSFIRECSLSKVATQKRQAYTSEYVADITVGSSASNSQSTSSAPFIHFSISLLTLLGFSFFFLC